MRAVFGFMFLVSASSFAQHSRSSNEAVSPSLYRKGTDCRNDIVPNDRSKFDRTMAEVKSIDRASYPRESYQKLIKQKATALSTSVSKNSQIGLLTEMFLRRYRSYPRIPKEQILGACERFSEWLRDDPDRIYYNAEDFLFSNGSPLLDWGNPKNTQEKAEESSFAKALDQIDKDDPDSEGITFKRAVRESSKQAKGMIDESILPHHNPHGLTRSEWIALMTYTGGHFSVINSALRIGQGAKYQGYIDTLNRALAKLPKAEGTLYRGAKFPPEVRATHVEGKIVDYNAFTSASMSRSAAEGFGLEDFAVIESKTARVVNNFGALAGAESEAIFPSGTKFKITRIEKSRDGNRTYYFKEVP